MKENEEGETSGNVAKRVRTSSEDPSRENQSNEGESSSEEQSFRKPPSTKLLSYYVKEQGWKTNIPTIQEVVHACKPQMQRRKDLTEEIKELVRTQKWNGLVITEDIKKGHKMCINANKAPCDCHADIPSTFGRMINHSRKIHNIMPKVQDYGGETPTILFYAERDLKPGTELFFDYGVRRNDFGEGADCSWLDTCGETLKRGDPGLAEEHWKILFSSM
ncbi:unnamed protein product [Ranitomeya imitator]|uniref:SET domain-containing protein n=1 Tax=Ranitomeya imitator TaxID=111125 RepID=A0ABN9LRD0_9NEOB|nr:unnamed protein product [Ranitomeya imitator]